MYPFRPTLTSKRRHRAAEMENLVSQIVSKQSLDALANLAFVRLRLESDGNKSAAPHFNLDEGSGTALYNLIHGDPCDANKELRDYVSPFAHGAEFGLAIAAAILTHQHDVPAMCKAIKAELRESVRDWPENLREIQEAA